MNNELPNAATITPPRDGNPNSAAAKPRGVTFQEGTKTNTRPSNKLDVRIEHLRPVFESQPPAIQSLLSDYAVAMLLTFLSRKAKRAGVLALNENEDKYPKSINLKCTLNFPKALKDDRETLANVQAWDLFVETTKRNLKKMHLKQAERTSSFFQEKLFSTFLEETVKIAQAYFIYHKALEDASNTHFTDQQYGAAAVYGFLHLAEAQTPFFETFLETDKDDSTEKILKRYLVIPNTVHYIFTQRQFDVAVVVA
jgi:hypothetical protein